LRRHLVPTSFYIHLDDSDYEELLSLSQEYQTDWLKERIETDLLDIFDFKETDDIVEGWLLSNQYNLKRLRGKLQNINFKQVNRMEELITHEKFYRLQTTTKYLLARKILAKHLWVGGVSFFGLLDKFFNIENAWVL